MITDYYTPIDPFVLSEQSSYEIQQFCSFNHSTMTNTLMFNISAFSIIKQLRLQTIIARIGFLFTRVII